MQRGKLLSHTLVGILTILVIGIPAAKAGNELITLVEDVDLVQNQTQYLPLIDVKDFREISFLGRNVGELDGDNVYFVFRFLAEKQPVGPGFLAGGNYFVCPIRGDVVSPCYLMGDSSGKTFMPPFAVTGPYVQVSIANGTEYQASVTLYLYGRK